MLKELFWGSTDFTVATFKNTPDINILFGYALVEIYQLEDRISFSREADVGHFLAIIFRAVRCKVCLFM